jgi:O-antigen/teichoic acid export membrane protein
MAVSAVRVKEAQTRGGAKFLINLFASILLISMNAAVHFFFTPYIVRAVGVEANGFVQLAANFAQYISLITIAVSSMSGRFITIAIEKGDLEKAGSYYTSIFWAYVALLGIMVILSTIVTAQLDSLINIPAQLVSDVKILFGFAFANYAAANIVSFCNTVFFVADRVYLQQTGKAGTELIKASLIILLFSLFYPKIWYMTVAQLTVVPVAVIWGIWNKNRLRPDLRIRNNLFSLRRLKEIVSAGIWRSVQSAGVMFLTGLDLPICNLFISPAAMGVLALSKTVPMLVENLNSQIVVSFAPKLTIYYANTHKEALWLDLKRSFKMLAIIGTIPLACLIVFGRVFFSLWVPGQDARELWILSILTCIQVALLAGVHPINNIFVAANKIKPQAISVIISGAVSTTVLLTALRFTKWGVYAVAGTSGVINLARYLIYAIPASASYLGFHKRRFYIGVLYSAICVSIALAIGAIVKFILKPDNWGVWILSCGITAVASLFASAGVILNRREKKALFRLARKWSSIFRKQREKFPPFP